MFLSLRTRVGKKMIIVTSKTKRDCTNLKPIKKVSAEFIQTITNQTDSGTENQKFTEIEIHDQFHSGTRRQCQASNVNTLKSAQHWKHTFRACDQYRSWNLYKRHRLDAFNIGQIWGCSHLMPDWVIFKRMTMRNMSEELLNRKERMSLNDVESVFCGLVFGHN